MDWLKEILGEAYTEDIDTRVSQEIERGFIPRESGGQMEAEAPDIDGLRRAVGEWEAKYKGLEEEVARREYQQATSAQVSALRFTSESAKRAFLTDLTARALPLDQGKLLGFDAFVKEYQKADAGAFAGDTPPRFVASTSGAALAAPDLKTQANDALRSILGRD